MVLPFMKRSENYAAVVEKQNFDGQYTVDSVIVTLAIALALYNSLEMLLLFPITFKRWRGLYFWSLAICNFGVICYTIGIMMGYFVLGVRWLGKSILDVGWILMITSQALVLYSRLGLILDNPKVLRGVKWMIILISTVILPTVCVLDFGTTYSSLSGFAQAYYIIEHIQMVVITLQELIISGLYVWGTIKLLKIISKTNTRRMVWQLFEINVIIIAMDYKHYQLYQESIKGFVYSVKLKLEMNILSKLVDLVHGNETRSMTLEAIDSNMMPSQVPVQNGRDVGLDQLSMRSSGKEIQSIQSQPKLDDSMDSRLESQMTQVHSHQSSFGRRTSGRESDILYADFLRTMK